MTTPMPDEILAVRRLAAEGGAFLLENFGAVGRVDRKGAVDLVTDIDRRSEERLLEAIAREFPDDAIVGEEGGDRPGRSGRLWYVDPLDGTTNYVHGYSHFAVSLACCDDDGPLFGAVCAPYLDEMYLAGRGQGAVQVRPRQGDERPLPCRRPVAFADALLATGFSYQRDERIDRICELVRRCLRGGCHGVRRAGSAAIDLAHVGAGRLDGYFEVTLRPWDVAAGLLICRETGCVVTDMEGAEAPLIHESVLAAVPQLHGELAVIVAD